MKHDEINPNDYDGGAAIEVKRHGDNGGWEIPGSSEVVAWDRMVEASETQSLGGHLLGWDPWMEWYQIFYEDELEPPRRPKGSKL